MKRLRSMSVVGFALLSGCSSPPAPAPAPPPPRMPPPVAAPPVALPVPSASSPAVVEPAAAKAPPVPFPPPTIDPPSGRSAQPGDGQWTRLGEGVDRVAAGSPALFRTVIHPHPVSRFVALQVVAIDLQQLVLRFRPGTDDPNLDQLPAFPAGLIPEAERPAAVAVFNGGFAPRHGRWGMAIRATDGAPLTPLLDPRPEGCTITIGPDDRVTIGPWNEAPVQTARAWRQTPPCLVHHGTLHPDLDRGALRPWAGRDPKRKTRRRSAIGVDATGSILFYGLGQETEPTTLASGMKAAGAVHVAQLDINWSWTKFLLLGTPPGQPLQVTTALIPQLKYSRRGYVEKAAFRDFFYLLRR